MNTVALALSAETTSLEFAQSSLPRHRLVDHNMVSPSLTACRAAHVFVVYVILPALLIMTLKGLYCYHAGAYTTLWIHSSLGMLECTSNHVYSYCYCTADMEPLSPHECWPRQPLALPPCQDRVRKHGFGATLT